MTQWTHCAPTTGVVSSVFRVLTALLKDNPLASGSEAYLQNHLEFSLLSQTPLRFGLRIGINYRGATVQHVELDGQGRLIGWNPSGDALGQGARSKLVLAGQTIVNRSVGEHAMSDTRLIKGDLPQGFYTRLEIKCRGWLGKTRNLDGKQLEKDLNLLTQGHADGVVIVLSEVAHRKWCGEGQATQAARRTGVGRFSALLTPLDQLPRAPASVSTAIRTDPGVNRQVTVREVAVEASNQSSMPGALHSIVFIS